jgi:PncC family amidohydrolase
VSEARPTGTDAERRLPILEAAFPEAAALGQALAGAGLTIAVAESCTGGLLGAAITAVPGSSLYMRGGVIAYADDVKSEQLGVGRHLLATHGAVSAEVAEAMAAGARDRFEADLGVAITGVAGPTSSEHKPAGLVFVAVAHGTAALTVRLDTDRGRELNRAHAVEVALSLCIEIVRRREGYGPPASGAS